MADTKTSDLSAATTLDGTELLALVQAGTSKKMAIAAVVAALGPDPITDALGYTPLANTYAAIVTAADAGHLELPDLAATAPGEYTLANSGIVVKNAAGAEIFRIWGTDPDDANFNSQNIYIGFQAGFSQPTDNVDAGYYNVGVGTFALHSTTIGTGNTANGISALRENTEGDNNTAVGANALKKCISGEQNVGIGDNAGVGPDSNQNRGSVLDEEMVFIGAHATRYGAGGYSVPMVNGIAIGAYARVEVSNTAVIGNIQVTDAYFGSAAAQANSHQQRAFIVGITAPADGDLAANQAAIWFDPTDGAAKIMVKAKQADGTVKTGSFNVQT